MTAIYDPSTIGTGAPPIAPRSIPGQSRDHEAMEPRQQFLTVETGGVRQSAEQDLWIAVVAQAFADAGWQHHTGGYGPDGPQPSDSREKYLWFSRAAARRWLLDRNVDFEEVCDLAGVDPNGIRAMARKMFEAGANA